LLLRAEALDSHGAVVEQYAFTQVTLGGVLDKSWINDKADAPAAGRDNPPNIVHHVPAGVPVSSSWRVDSLPPGFKKIIEVQRRLGKEGSVTQMVFSDGLAGISLFIEKSDSHEDEHPGLYSQGVIQVYSKIVHDSFITVVGEVPPQTAMQVADSVRFAGGTE
jgi:sigma-E factor negative regulatory protein RseB